MHKRHIEMRNVEQIAGLGRARDQELLPQRVNWNIDNFHLGTKALERWAIRGPGDNAKPQIVSGLREAVQQIFGVGSDSSDQPSRVDCHQFIHGHSISFDVS
jgi:hypothetical protein